MNNNVLVKPLLAFAICCTASLSWANSRYEQMANLPDPVKMDFFEKVLAYQPTGCDEVLDVLAMGVNDQGIGRWTVYCANQAAYLVRVMNDPQGSLSTLACDAADISEPCIQFKSATPVEPAITDTNQQAPEPAVVPDHEDDESSRPSIRSGPPR